MGSTCCQLTRGSSACWRPGPRSGPRWQAACFATSAPVHGMWCPRRPCARSMTPVPTCSASSAWISASPTASARSPGTSWPARSRSSVVAVEPRLQAGVSGGEDGGKPVQVIFRGLEGVQLLAEPHAAALAALPARVAESLAYDAERGWNRVVYCLVVNHLAELA